MQSVPSLSQSAMPSHDAIATVRHILESGPASLTEIHARAIEIDDDPVTTGTYVTSTTGLTVAVQLLLRTHVLKEIQTRYAVFYELISYTDE